MSTAAFLRSPDRLPKAFFECRRWLEYKFPKALYITISTFTSIIIVAMIGVITATIIHKAWLHVC